MGETEISGISVGEFGTVSELLASNESLQIGFVIMIIGMIAIAVIYRKFSHWIRKKKFSYARPHVSRFVRKAILPLFAIVLITATNAYMQSFSVFDQELDQIDGELTPSGVFGKILDTFNILVIAFTISSLIPIALTKREKRGLEKEDYDKWYDNRGFSDDDGDLFHKCFKWNPPKVQPEDLSKEEFEKHLQTKEGRKILENFRTTKGNPLGGYEEIVDDPEEIWKQSERNKYEKYFSKCITGENQSGRKLRPGVIPEEIYPIDVWREEKRITGFEPIIPSSRPPGFARKKREGIPKSAQKILPLGIFVAAILGVVAWWGVDLIVLATATGGMAIGIGLALQQTMENYLAYLMIRKDKIVVEGDRVQLQSGFNGYVHKITSRVTYVRHGLHESLAIVPTKSLITAQVINYTKDNKLVPAIVKVGVSYLNDPKQVASILVKVGKRGMKEIVDGRGRHLIRQNRCPYLDENMPSCGCDKEILIDIQQPTVRFNDFNDSSLDFAMFVFVRDYGSQFKTKTDLRMMMYEEFKKYDIRIPWPIRTVYQGDEKREAEEIRKGDEKRNKVMDEFGTGDILKGEGEGD